MDVNVIIFGKLIDITGSSSLTINNVTDTAQLNEQLRNRFPGLSAYPYIMAVEKEIIHVNTLLQNNNTVALLPPYAGG